MAKITRTTFTRQYEHIGNVRHGVQTGPWRIEISAPVKDEADSLQIVQGSIVQLNDDGEFQLGCDAGVASQGKHPVPFISMKNAFDPDVTTGYGGLVKESYTQPVAIDSTSTTTTTITVTHGAPYHTYSAEGGKIVAIPCTCGYELETTEFNPAATWTPNLGVVPGTSTLKGKADAASTAPGGASPYLGFVSVPPRKDYFGGTRLAFLTNFIPANFA